MSFVWFKRLALIAPILALCVVVLGAYVRLSDAGLGCPDWPGCYGTLTVPQSQEAIANAQINYPSSTIETHKAWKEMIHRYLAGSLGLVVLALFVLAWKNKSKIMVTPWLPSFLLGLIIFQAALGMWTVTMLLKPVVVSAHLLGGMSTLALLTWLAHRHWCSKSTLYLQSNFDGKLIRAGLVILFCQIVLGGWTSTNYAALACTDFPTCHGAWVPPMDFKDAFYLARNLGENAQGGNLTLASLTAIQWTHRVGAIITLICLGFLAINSLKYAQLKKLSYLLIVLLVGQISLGVANLVLHLPLVLAVAHNFGAALLVVVLVIFNSKITKHQLAY